MLHVPTSVHYHQHVSPTDARGHRRTATMTVSSSAHSHHPMAIPTPPKMLYRLTVPVYHVPVPSPNWTTHPVPIPYSMDAHPAHATGHRRRMSVGGGTFQHPMYVTSNHTPFPVDRTPLPGYPQLVRSPAVPIGHHAPFVPSPHTSHSMPQPTHVHSQPRMRRNSLPVSSVKPPVIKRTRFADEVEVHWLDVDEVVRKDGSSEGPTKLRKARHHAAAGGT